MFNSRHYELILPVFPRYLLWRERILSELKAQFSGKAICHSSGFNPDIPPPNNNKQLFSTLTEAASVSVRQATNPTFTSFCLWFPPHKQNNQSQATFFWVSKRSLHIKGSLGVSFLMWSGSSLALFRDGEIFSEVGPHRSLQVTGDMVFKAWVNQPLPILLLCLLSEVFFLWHMLLPGHTASPGPIKQQR